MEFNFISFAAWYLHFPFYIYTGYLYIELLAFRFNYRVLNIFDKGTLMFKLIVQLSNTSRRLMIWQHEWLDNQHTIQVTGIRGPGVEML